MAYFVGTLFLIICVLLIIVVLLQKGKGGGLGAAFGGMASSAFGTRVGDVFTWVTIILVALFLLLAIAAIMLFRPSAGLVAAPYFTPSPEEFTDYDAPAFVKIESATPDAEIWYTLDGSDPSSDSESSIRYESAVRIESGTTLKARAYRSGGWIPSHVRQAYYGPEVPGEVEESTPGEVPPEAEAPGRIDLPDLSGSPPQPSSLPAPED